MKSFKEFFIGESDSLNESSNVDKVMSELKRIFPKKNFSVTVATNKTMEIDFEDNYSAVKFVNQHEGFKFHMSIKYGKEKTVVIEFDK